MSRRIQFAICLATALATTACSTRPRTFSAMVDPIGGAPLVATSEGTTFTTCDQLVRSGRKSGFAAAAAQSAATGVGLFAGAAGVAASGTVGIGATAGGAVLSAAIPFVGIAAGLGINRLIRSGRERKYKAGMTSCMQEFGYDVVEWNRAPKKQPGTATLRALPGALDAEQVPAAIPAAIESAEPGQPATTN